MSDASEKDDSRSDNNDNNSKERDFDNRYSFERGKILEENLSQRDDQNRKVSNEY